VALGPRTGDELSQALQAAVKPMEGCSMWDSLDTPRAPLGILGAIFCAAAVSCFLLAAHRLARGTLLAGRVVALGSLEDAYTPEERELLIHKIKLESIR